MINIYEMMHGNLYFCLKIRKIFQPPTKMEINYCDPQFYRRRIKRCMKYGHKIRNIFKYSKC